MKLYKRALCSILAFFMITASFIGCSPKQPSENTPATNKTTVKSPQFSQYLSVENNKFHFGLKYQEHEKTLESFVSKVFSKQVAEYNKNAKNYWPDNRAAGVSAIVESLETKKCWLVSDLGEVTEIPKSSVAQYFEGAGAKKEFENLNNLQEGFAFFNSQTMGVKGVFIKASEDQNYNMTQRYLHVGSYDLIRTLAHESFHEYEQAPEKWKMPSTISEAEQSTRLSDVNARAKRIFLEQQLAEAIASDDKNRETLAKDACATYEDYKAKFPEDFKASQLWDWLEGCAFYYELVSVPYICWPDQIKSESDLYSALGLIILSGNELNGYFRGIGTIEEGYRLGAYAGLLIDKLTGKPKSWADSVMGTLEYSPLDALSDHFKGEALPDAKEVPKEFQEIVINSIDE